MRWFTGLALIGAVACTGEEEEAGAACDSFVITATVVDVDGEPSTDAVVELNNVECANNGDGSYACQATYVEGLEEDLRAYHLVAIHGAFSPAATFVQLPEGFCEGVTVPLQLGVMMGA
jgi:hypothetical protein